jgi:hypothetical protein
MFMVDLAVPRDIDPATAELDDVYLYTVDDLKDIIQENLRSRQAAAAQAEEIIDSQVEHFMAWLRTQDSAASIRALRQRAEAVRDEALARAQRQLAQGKNPADVLNFWPNTLTNKLIHPPCAGLREAAAKAMPKCLNLIKNLYRLATGVSLPMNPSMLAKLEQLAARHEEVSALLANRNHRRQRPLPRFVGGIRPVGAGGQRVWAYRRVLDDLDSAREMAGTAIPICAPWLRTSCWRRSAPRRTGAGAATFIAAARSARCRQRVSGNPRRNRRRRSGAVRRRFVAYVWRAMPNCAAGSWKFSAKVSANTAVTRK